MPEATEVRRFCHYLRVRNYSAHTVENYHRDLRLFFEQIDRLPKKVTWRDVDRFVERQHARLSNRRAKQTYLQTIRRVINKTKV